MGISLMNPHYLISALLLASTASSSALNIVFNTAAGMDQSAINGFEAAAAYWEGVLTDDVTINIDVNFTTLDPGTLGQAGSTTQSVTVSDYFSALGADATTSSDAIAVAHLPGLTGGSIKFLTQVNTESGSTAISEDNDGSANNVVLSMNTANAKAVGLFTGSAAASDAEITFSDSFSWDFDQSDGIDAGKEDFVGVAIHEIGHSLGFNSGVDIVDYAIGANLDLENYRIFTGLDMFRYTADGVLNLAAGAAAYFSIDGGATNLGLFSTGYDYGDGSQASHWKDGLGLGIMDPTANPAGEINSTSELDLQAFDVIRWDLNSDGTHAVPEPSAFALVALGGGMLLMRRRRA